MRQMKFRSAGRKLAAFLLFTSLISTVLSSVAQAVTNGDLVADPKSDAPYVVSIWTSAKSNDYKDAEFICTGTLIGPQVVLTAAHCTTLTTPYFVKVGAGALNDNSTFTAVSGVWTSPRYNSKTYANDIGLLKLVDRFENLEFPTLASSITAKSINKFSRLKIFGWGLDQEDNIADLLRTSDLSLQDVLAAKSYGKAFNLATMLAAGRKIPSENIWSGACNGDSGGPLLSKINGINVIVGVTSWGARKCLPNKPSIFSRVSYYEKDIRNGIKEVEAQSVVVNRTAPIATTEPVLNGQAKPGEVLKCSPGVWKNAVSIQTSWLSPARLVGSTKTEITVLPTDGGSEFRCEVIVASVGASVRRVLRTSITGSATLASNPSISGLSSFSTLKSGMTARCEGWNWRTPVDSERVTWFTATNSLPSVPVNGRQVGSGSTLTLDSSILKDENGRYLICQVTGIRDGFEAHFTASKFITTPAIPSLSYVSVNAYSLSQGSTATCAYSSYGEIETTRIDWGHTSNSGFFTPIPGFAGNKISITTDLARQAAGKALACRVTLINSGGEISRIASSYSSFEDLPAAPSVNTSISGTADAGKTAYCSASSNNSWGVTTSYQWGKTSAASSKYIEGNVLSTNSYYTLSSSDMTTLGGAHLTCVVTITNSIGSTSSASSISIPSVVIQIPLSSAPTVDLQTPATTSIAVRIRIPLITGYNANTMKATLNLMNAPSCRNLEVVPGQAYECAGLSANTTYTADITVAPRTGTGISRTSDNLRFTTVGLSNATNNTVELPVPADPIFRPISATQVEVTLPGIPGFNSDTMSAQLYIYWQTSLTAVGIDGSAKVLVVNANMGQTHTGYIVLRGLSNGLETRSRIISFTMPTLTTGLVPRFGASTISQTTINADITNFDARYSWLAAFSSGSVPGASAVIANNQLVISGLSAGATVTVCVTTRRSGYQDGSGCFTGSTSPAVALSIPLYWVVYPSATYCPNQAFVAEVGFGGANGAIAGISIEFNFNGNRFNAVTNQEGKASYSYTPSINENTISVSASHAGGTKVKAVQSTTRTATKASNCAPIAGLIPAFGPRVANSYDGGFNYQITNYDSNYSWAVSTTAGSASINSSGLVSVIRITPRQSVTFTVTSTRSGYASASASITSVGPWNLSDEIQAQNITATLSGTTLTVNVPNANSWNWSLIWDGGVQRTNITSFPFTVTGFSTNKNIQLGATDNLQNYGYSRVFLPTLQN
jgi:secreted trypsin-like serine protease